MHFWTRIVPDQEWSEASEFPCWLHHVGTWATSLNGKQLQSGLLCRWPSSQSLWLTSACGYALADPTSNKTREYFPPSDSCPPIFTMLAFIWYIVFGKILLFSSNRLAPFELFLNYFFQSCFSSLLSPSQCCLSVFKFRKLNKDWLRLEGKASLSDSSISSSFVG